MRRADYDLSINSLRSSFGRIRKMSSSSNPKKAARGKKNKTPSPSKKVSFAANEVVSDEKLNDDGVKTADGNSNGDNADAGLSAVPDECSSGNDKQAYDEFGCVKGMPITADDIDVETSEGGDTHADACDMGKNEEIKQPVNGESIKHGESEEGHTGKQVEDVDKVQDRPSYAEKLKASSSKKSVNFRKIENLVAKEGVDVVLPRESVRVVQDRFANTLFGYFLGDRLAYPVVEYYAKNNWTKFGLQKVMMNANGYFFFKFSSKKGMLDVLEGGPWLIRNIPIFLNEWSPRAKLQKEEIKEIAVWIKIHNVPLAAYTDDGLSMLSSALGNPKMLDAYTSAMCTKSWGRSSFARALIETSAASEFKNELSIEIPDLDGDGFARETMRVEYEWKPPRCAHCCVFGHNSDVCPKQVRQTKKKDVVDEEGFTEVKGKKKGVNKAGFNLNKQKARFEYRPVVSKKDSKDVPSTSGTNAGPSSAQVGKSSASITTSNPFDVLDADDDMGIGKGCNEPKGSNNSYNVTIDSDGGGKYRNY